MRRTSEKIMALFQKHQKVKAGTVLTSTEFSPGSPGWEPADFAEMDEAFKELSDEGFVIITPSKGLELTEKGLSYLLNEP